MARSTRENNPTGLNFTNADVSPWSRAATTKIKRKKHTTTVNVCIYLH